MQYDMLRKKMVTIMQQPYIKCMYVCILCCLNMLLATASCIASGAPSLCGARGRSLTSLSVGLTFMTSRGQGRAPALYIS